MDAPPPKDVTELLRRAGKGDPAAGEELFSVAYAELRGLAGRVFGAPNGATMQPSALVHEAWIKLSPHVGGLANRRHFFAVAAKAMRQVLANEARSRGRLKRGDARRGRVLTTLDGSERDEGFDLVALNDVLGRLEQLDARQARVVELRFLGGLTIAEASEELGVSHTTVEDDWSLARAWLRRELARDA